MKTLYFTLLSAVLVLVVKPNSATVCEQDEFQCSNGECITNRWRCDGDADCPGKDDEVGCTYTCGPDNYACNNGQCIPEYWKCDRDTDCEDGSDENSGGVIRCPA